VTLRDFVFAATALSFAYLIVVFGAYALLLVFAALDNAIRTRDARSERLDGLEASRFTIPVSVLVPVHNEATVIQNVLAGLRALRYPQLEIIIVDDGSTDSTLLVLTQALDLRPAVTFERRLVETEEVDAVYRSRIDERVTVVAKRNGGKADALNCALNHARYRYVCCVDGDTFYLPDALLHNMRIVMRDPRRVVGVTGHISVSTRPEHARGAHIENRLLSNFQHIEYLRSFLNNRLAWSRLNFMLCSSGAFAIWRRDLLEELGGFARDFTCEDIEMTFRAHEYLRRNGRDYRILSTPQIVARTEVPATLRALIAQRERWQRVTLETLWKYRGVASRPYGIVGIVGVPFYFVTEVLAAPMDALAFASLGAGVYLHLWDWRLYAVFAATMAIANGILTTAAILMEDISTRAYRLGHIARLIVLGPLELVLYRPLLVVARFKGFWRFFRGDRSWRKFDRNLRTAS
jgi:cellulose synthase/poly-beta-1,6-N-acetylglucosamine synthase-like glycosyltransferase